MAKNDFQYGRCNSYTLQCGTIVSLISPGDCMPLWHVALKSWQWIHQVAAPWNVIRGSGMTSLNSPGGSTLQCGKSTCHSAPVSKILSKSDHPWQKKMMSCQFSRWRISAILDFRDPIMGSLKSPHATSYRSSIDTIVLKCLVFEKISIFLHFGDRQTNEQMDSTDALSRCRERRLNNTADNNNLPIWDVLTSKSSRANCVTVNVDVCPANFGHVLAVSKRIVSFIWPF